MMTPPFQHLREGRFSALGVPLSVFPMAYLLTFLEYRHGLEVPLARHRAVFSAIAGRNSSPNTAMPARVCSSAEEANVSAGVLRPPPET